MSAETQTRIVEGWCVNMHREVPIMSGPTPATLQGDVTLNRELTLAYKTQSYGLFTLLLTVHCSDLGDAVSSSACVEPWDIASRFEQEQAAKNGSSRAILHIEYNDYYNQVTGKLTFTVSAPVFQTLFRQMDTPPAALRVDFVVEGLTAAGILILDDDEASDDVIVSAPELRVSSDMGYAHEVIHRQSIREVTEGLAAEWLDRGFGGQVRRIVQELSTSAADLRFDFRQRCDLRYAVSELIQLLRPAFREKRSLPDDTLDNIWDLGPEDFLSAIASLNDKEQSELKSDYTYLWKHFNLQTVLLFGEAKSQATNEGFRPYVEILEEGARNLLELRGAHTETLEWALINALVYAECIAFAQHVSFDLTNLTGQLRGIKHKGWMLKALLKLTWRSAVELFKVGTTFIAVSVLSNDNNQTALLITTVITAARWLYSAIKSEHPGAKDAQMRVLGDMISVHSLLSRTDFNANFLLHSLYVTTEKGAVFSPWVYNLLDARIKRKKCTTKKSDA